MLLSDNLLARFWAKVAKGMPDECWLWTAAIGTHGYGVFGIMDGTKTVTSHRLSYEIHNGPIPIGKSILHSCDVRACCNPGHLRSGTHRDNTDDMLRRNRHPRGEAHCCAVLTADKVIAARRRHRALGESWAQLGRHFGVEPSTIRDAIIGRNWAHINAFEEI